MNQLGSKLRDLREEKDLKQKEVADILHISNKLLSSYERNIIVPPADTIKLLCEFYNVSADYLLSIDNNDSTRQLKISKEKSDAINDSAFDTMSALTDEQKKLLKNFSRLNNENKEAIMGLMIVYYKDQQLRDKGLW